MLPASRNPFRAIKPPSCISSFILRYSFLVTCCFLLQFTNYILFAQEPCHVPVHQSVLSFNRFLLLHTTYIRNSCVERTVPPDTCLFLFLFVYTSPLVPLVSAQVHHNGSKLQRCTHFHSFLSCSSPLHHHPDLLPTIVLLPFPPCRNSCRGSFFAFSLSVPSPS